MLPKFECEGGPIAMQIKYGGKKKEKNRQLV